jgi:hypothetical protein
MVEELAALHSGWIAATISDSKNGTHQAEPADNKKPAKPARPAKGGPDSTRTGVPRRRGVIPCLTAYFGGRPLRLEELVRSSTGDAAPPRANRGPCVLAQPGRTG